MFCELFFGFLLFIGFVKLVEKPKVTEKVYIIMNKDDKFEDRNQNTSE